LARCSAQAKIRGALINAAIPTDAGGTQHAANRAGYARGVPNPMRNGCLANPQATHRQTNGKQQTPRQYARTEKIRKPAAQNAARGSAEMPAVQPNASTNLMFERNEQPRINHTNAACCRADMRATVRETHRCANRVRTQKSRNARTTTENEPCVQNARGKDTCARRQEAQQKPEPSTVPEVCTNDAQFRKPQDSAAVRRISRPRQCR